MTSCSSGFKASSEKFLQLSCCNIKKFLSYSKNYICRFMKANSWQIIPLSFVLLILESVERKGKITKIWISWERTAFFFWWSHHLPMCRKIQSYTTTIQILKTRNFNKEKITQRHSLKPNTNWNFKVPLVLAINTLTVEFLVCIFFQFSNNFDMVI